MPQPQSNPTSRTIFRFRYSIKANEYVTHVVAIQDAEKGVDGVVTNPCGTIVMDERTFTEFRAAVAENPQFEFFER